MLSESAGLDFLGIRREPVFSPGKVGDDRGILDAVAGEIAKTGARVVSVDGSDGSWPTPGPDTIVFAMCQGEAALSRLEAWERRGIRVVNSTRAIRNSQRHLTIPLLRDIEVGLPESVVVSTSESDPLPPSWDDTPIWVKRGDVHATVREDVVRVESRAAGIEALQAFAARGIGRVALQRHAEGKVLKFYGVTDRFFYCPELPATGHHTFQAEPRAKHSPSALATQIREIGRRATRALGLEIYGGDCVYGNDGRLSLIDLNDWPSYGPCRAQAAAAIAAYIIAQKEEV